LARVTPAANRADRARARTLLSLAMRRPGHPFFDMPARAVIVDFDRQQLYLAENGEAVACYPVSTARALGSAENSNLTPPGWHRVHARIGDGEPEGAVFESREPTGRIWHGETDAGDLILHRILTLEGLEDGVNRGAGVDSLERYIYIHGTNHVGRLGTPVSHGCVRMACGDVRDLFERIDEGDPVVILSGAQSVA
jgi:UDP-N-acetylmuramate--alanine ligase